MIEYNNSNNSSNRNIKNSNNNSNDDIITVRLINFGVVDNPMLIDAEKKA